MSRLSELEAKRHALRRKAAREREELAVQGAALIHRLRWLDTMYVQAMRLHHKPMLMGGIMSAISLVATRPRGIWKWVRLAFGTLGLFRRTQKALGAAERVPRDRRLV